MEYLIFGSIILLYGSSTALIIHKFLSPVNRFRGELQEATDRHRGRVYPGMYDQAVDHKVNWIKEGF